MASYVLNFHKHFPVSLVRALRLKGLLQKCIASLFFLDVLKASLSLFLFAANR